MRLEETVRRKLLVISSITPSPGKNRSNISLHFTRLDVGGTSTDVSRFDGRYDVVYETTTAGVTIQSPQIHINTVAAGGGSCLTFKHGLFMMDLTVPALNRDLRVIGNLFFPYQQSSLRPSLVV